MKEYLLVDGYNIIHAWKELEALIEKVSLECARQKLIDLLANYKGMNNQTIILVFDAYLVKGNLGKVSKYQNIFVVYTKEAETADTYIERVVTNLPKHYHIRVATGDRLEQFIIQGQGALRMTAQELRVEIDHQNRYIREQFMNQKQQKSQVKERMTKETFTYLESLRRKK